jgi:intraflagellar transport protein 172
VALGGEQGAKLLTKFGLIEQAIDYATESGAFEHAFALAQNSKREKLPEVHLKYAMYLEDEGRFAEAEKEFIKADKPKEAIDMYVHQQDWANATRVSEANDPGSMPDILVAQAKAAIERSEFTKAESLFVRAKKPDAAVKAYKQANRWQDAIRIAREFLPHKVQELMGEHAAFMRGEQGLGAQSHDELMARGRQLEEGREFSQAIDAYLQVTAAQTKSHDFLEEVWENAVKLAMNHVPARIAEVVEIVSKRLVEISRFAQAAELYEGVDKHREAIAVYMQGGMWDQARDLARQMGPKVEKEVTEAHRRSMAETGAAEDLVHSGNVAEGIEAYAQKGDWDKCREVAEQQGAHMLVKYATLHGAALIQQSTFAGAAKIFATYGTATTGNNVSMYRRLAKEILATGDYDGGEVDTKSTRSILHLRQMLAKVVAGVRQGGDEALTREFENLLWIAHMTAAKDVAEERGATEARRKLSLSLLRHIRTIPADKAFYDAGQCCRQANDLSMAFVFLNRYLDITEAMEEQEGNSTTLDNSDFADTGIPFDFPLPDRQFLSDKDREKVRDYVLEISMNEKIQQTLNVTELSAVFKESDVVREGVLRGGRGSNDELFMIMRDTVAQV